MRVRHYTRISSMRKIVAEQRIVARDQNKVFVVLESAKKLSPADIEEFYDLDVGKGNAYIEFDVQDNEVMTQRNRRLGIEEQFVVSDVELQHRNPVAIFNIGGAKQWYPRQ